MTTTLETALALEAAAKSATGHANEPRTFARSERAQEPPRWQVDKGMHFWFAHEPIGPDGCTITIFPTFADAIAFADRQARS